MTGFAHATKKAAWRNLGWRHALNDEPRQPPERGPELRWYLDGYNQGRAQKQREKAGIR